MPLAMSQLWLVLGPPGCGKTSWIRDQLVRHPGPCAYWRLQGPSFDNFEQGLDGGIDGLNACECSTPHNWQKSVATVLIIGLQIN